MRKKRLVSLLAVLAILVSPLPATWSIVAIDTRTGEVAVASATCLAGDVLKRYVPVVLVGKGGAAVQSSVDMRARNKAIIWDGFQLGQTSGEILNRLRNEGPSGLSTRQFGLCSSRGPSRTFTGSDNGDAATGVSGTVNGIRYAIQGNVLAGDEVVVAAQDAFLATGGDLVSRVMAAMEAARATGGDGRCSCSGTTPDSCGAPPPDFDKTAHIGFVTVARPGDEDGDCTAPLGCANGDYYLDLDFPGFVDDPDPVFVLQAAYEAWRAERAGHPDHFLSSMVFDAQRLPADGRSTASLTIQLVDIEGAPIGHGGARLDVRVPAAQADRLSAGAVTDHGDGTYSVEVVAGLETGVGRLSVEVDDGFDLVRLSPRPGIRIERPGPLFCGFETVAIPSDTTVPLTLSVPTARNLPYVILASSSGSSPGQSVSGVHLPLNKDAFFVQSLIHAGDSGFFGTVGLLDGDGRAEALFAVPRRVDPGLFGLRVDWAAIVFDDELLVTNLAGFDVVLGATALTFR